MWLIRVDNNVPWVVGGSNEEGPRARPDGLRRPADITIPHSEHTCKSEQFSHHAAATIVRSGP
jgi:hypothetical protein